MSRNKGLTPAEHVEVSRLLKRARNDLLEAAMMCRCYGKLSDQLAEIADGLPTGWLEKRLIEAVGADGQVEGVHVRDVYFGELKEVEDA
jgi:hypothetical protein